MYLLTKGTEQNEMNEFLTKDIKISTDSAGFMTAEHKNQGTLIESSYYETRKECRIVAVEILKEKKENGNNESYEAQERRLEREANKWMYE